MRENFTRSAFDFADKAKAQRKKGRNGYAQDLLEQGLSAYPDNSALLVQMGNLYRDTRRDDYAMETYAYAFSRNPNSQAAIMSYANFLTTKREFEKAENIYAHMFALNGQNDMRLLTALGNLYQNAGRKPLAAACFGRALKLPDADDYARGRYTEICGHYSPGYRDSEWAKFLTRMQDRKGAALADHTALPRPEALAPRRPAISPDPATVEQPAYHGPVWS